LLAQVAGRAGRGPKGGPVIVQTRNQEHPALRFAAAHDVEGFLDHEAQERQDPAYPPSTSLLNLVISGEEEGRARAESQRVADWISQLSASHEVPLVVLGPAPCPITRIKGHWRWHVLVKGAPDQVGRLVRYAAPRLEGARGTRIVLDRDPVALL